MRHFLALIVVALSSFLLLPSQGWTESARGDDKGKDHPVASKLEQAQSLVVRLAKEDKALESLRMSEHTKARSLVEGMAAQLAEGVNVDVPADVLDKTNQMSDTLDALKKQRQEAFQKGDTKLAGELEKQVEEQETHMAAHVDWLRKEHPVFAAVKFPGPLGLSHIPLKMDEWVLDYCVTESGTVIYLIHGNRLVKTLFKPIPRKELSDLVRRFTTYDHNVGSFEKTLSSFDCALGKKLTDMLLSGILSDLPESAPLTIVPDGCLTELPFETLVLNEGGTVEKTNRIPIVSGARFFGDLHPISYCQSLTVLALTRMRGNAPKPGDRILVMADPIFSTDDPRCETDIRKRRRNIIQHVPGALMSLREQSFLTFPRLEGTGELANVLQRLHPNRTDVYVGARATKSNLLGTSPAQYGTIAIATHGYSGTDLPGIPEPVLVLTLVDQPDGQDGYLRMSEVMGLKLNADLVALIAGGSGSGPFVPGEGVLSVGRAFQYAGARTTLVNIAGTTERAAVKLAGYFFSNLAAGKTKREALKLAKDQIRKDGYDHPFFWGAFVLIGAVD